MYANILHTIGVYSTAWNEPSPTVWFLSNDDCRVVINSTEPRLLPYFNKQTTKGMYKADICRVAALYERGGYYFDIDIRALKAVMLPKKTRFATVWDEPPRADNTSRSFFQAFLASDARNPILKEALRIMLDYYEGRHDLHGYMGPSTLRDAYFAVDPSTRGDDNNTTILLMQINLDKKRRKRDAVPYPNLTLQSGRGCCCNYIVHDPDTEIAYFFSRIVGVKGNRHCWIKAVPNASQTLINITV
jgi:hypothetical protein